MVDFVRDRGWSLNSPEDPDLRGGCVMVGSDRHRELVAELARQNVFVDSRPGAGLRISSHFFNTDEEVEEALDILAGLMD